MLKERDTVQPRIEPTLEVPSAVLQTPIDVRSTSLAVLALIAVIGLLYSARAVFIPIAIAVLASYALTPVVDWLKRRARLPKAVGAG
jgi:predicted PurR-regulated permease PerM